MIGAFGESLYRKKETSRHSWKDVSSFFTRASRIALRRNEVGTDVEQPPAKKPDTDYKCEKSFGKQEMLRDIFLWSVYAGYVDIAFVLLLQLKSRIGAALMAASFAQRLSLMGRNLYLRNMYNEQRKLYEEYGVSCINACYKQNDHYSCQLLLREVTLFGKMTCMQVSRTWLISPINTFLPTGSHFITHNSLHQHTLL